MGWLGKRLVHQQRVNPCEVFLTSIRPRQDDARRARRSPGGGGGPRRPDRRRHGGNERRALAPTKALARVIRAFEPLAQLPKTLEERRPRYLSLLRGKRVLLILDNARDGDQVSPLLPPESCALIVTARHRDGVQRSHVHRSPPARARRGRRPLALDRRR
jgi:hypothetical protein